MNEEDRSSTPTIAELREKLASRTGEWSLHTDPRGTVAILADHPRYEETWQVAIIQAGQEACAELAVAAVNALPALLDRIEKLEAGLRPFVNAAEYLEAETTGFDSGDTLWLTFVNEVGSSHGLYDGLTFGDFQRLLTKDSTTKETDT